jgi:lipopolysaccharide/colanic/teichoic acid biosynthesis glycosyltransferase
MGDARTVSAGRRPGPYRGKRLVDLAILAVVAIPAIGIGSVCSVAIRLTSQGPIFFRQVRVGMDGRPFTIWKFRTMVDAGDNPLIPSDAHITGAGRWMRRTSLDELPQLLNVAAGEMSIVGPRPTLAYQVERYDDRQRGRLSVRQGITGLAQIRGRNEIDWAARIDHDLEYVARQSAWLDVRILLATARAVTRGAGVEGHSASDPISAPPPSPSGRRTARVDQPPT